MLQLHVHSQRGWDKHQIALFSIDSCYLQLARDKHVQRKVRRQTPVLLLLLLLRKVRLQTPVLLFDYLQLGRDNARSGSSPTCICK